MTARTPLEDCRRSRKLDAEYNRTVIANLVSQRDAMRDALELIAGKGWSSLCAASAAEEMHTMAVSALAIADGAR